jgi:hypothetical protein
MLFLTIVSVYNRLHAPKQDSAMVTSASQSVSEPLSNREKAMLVATIDTKLYGNTNYTAQSGDKDDGEDADDDFPFDDVDTEEMDEQHIGTLDAGVPGEYQLPTVINEMTEEEAEEILDAMTPEPDENVRSAAPGEMS